MNETESLMLKSDVRGRVRTPAAQREALLDEFARSGLSAARFTALTGVKYQTFCSWQQKRRRLDAASKPALAVRSPAPQFVEAVAREHQRPSLLVRLPGQASLELSHAEQTQLAAALLLALAKGGASC